MKEDENKKRIICFDIKHTSAKIQKDQNMNFQEEIRQIDKEVKSIDRQIVELKERKNELLASKQSLLEQQNIQEAELLANSQNWESAVDFPWSANVHQVLKERFQLSKFRPLQLSAINATLNGNDVLVIMPTGGGKSLCYQLPALASGNGFTLVVSPLVSLMEDQVMALKKLKIPAEMLCASTDKKEVTRILNDMVNAKGELKLLYVTPEKLSKSKRFMAKLQKSYSLGLFNRLAIDEVHCCSVWGHDFRPDYKFLGVVRNLCPKTPILGLTATCTSHVTEDVKKILAIPKAMVIKSPLNRPNLLYEVRPKPDSHEGCLDLLEKMLKNEFAGQSGIIYTLSTKDVDTLTRDLRGRGLRVGAYHANLEADYRSSIHKKWLSGTCQAVIATIAFGMGIDKPDVRFVLHHCMSKSMENFYQESGRAGRDGLKAKCILLYKFMDTFRLSIMVFTEQTGLEKLYGIVAYGLNSSSCRRKLIAQHFGEEWDSTQCSQMCDICIKSEFPGALQRQTNVSAVADSAFQILIQAQSQDSKMTALKLLDALMGKGPSKLSKKPVGDFSRTQMETIVAKLLIEGYFREDFHFTPYNTISYILPGSRNLRSPLNMDIPGNVSKSAVKSVKKQKKEVIQVSDSDDAGCDYDCGDCCRDTQHKYCTICQCIR